MANKSRGIHDVTKSEQEKNDNRVKVSLSINQAEKVRKLLLQQSKKKQKRRKLLIIAAIIVPAILLITMLGGWRYVSNHNKPIQPDNNPVPSNIRKAVTFPIYVPDQKKLPAVYTLDVHSFSSPQEGVVLYNIDIGNGKKIIISLQTKPSDAEIQQFYANYLPLHEIWDMQNGTALVGAHQQRGGPIETVVSLPVRGEKSWIFMTAPGNIDKNDLKQTLSSLTK